MNLTSNKKWVLGLTGSILSGKSTALAFFKSQGIFTLSADELVAQLYQTPLVQKKVKALFGTLDKSEIAAQIFNNDFKRKQLEQVLHPLVLNRARQLILQAKEPLVVFEVPLLFESGWDKKVDLTLLIKADPKSLTSRLKQRAMSRKTYLARLKTQWPESEKEVKSDIILFHKNKTDLKQKINHLCKAFELLKLN